MSDGSLLTSLEFFEKFSDYYASGLGPRIEGEIESDGPEITNSNRLDLAADVAEGALMGRTIWGGEGAECTGCFLWTGDLSVLLGEEEPRAVSSLSDEEVDTLDKSLKLNIEEGGEEKPPVDWSDVERIDSEALDAKMNEIGVAMEFEIATLSLTVAGRKMEFRFIMATEVPEGAEEEADATEATEDDPIAAAAAAAMAAAAAAADEAAQPEPAGPVTVGGIPAEQLHNLEHLLDVPLPLTIRLGSLSMNLDELLRLTPGAILELNRREEEPLEVLANEQVVARGEVVVVDERFGLRITEIGSSEDRLRAL